MTSLSTAILVFVAFLVGRRRRRITHEPPRTVQLSLVQWQRGMNHKGNHRAITRG